MTVSTWTEADSNRVREIWSEYRQRHDVSSKVGQTAGIDPVSGCIWFGDSIQDVIAQRQADGSATSLFFIRVGSETYYRQGRPPLIDGIITEDGVFLVDFPFDGRTVRAQTTFVDGDEILLGTGLLRDYQLRIDFPARTVAIETS